MGGPSTLTVGQASTDRCHAEYYTRYIGKLSVFPPSCIHLSNGVTAPDFLGRGAFAKPLANFFFQHVPFRSRVIFGRDEVGRVTCDASKSLCQVV